MTKNKDKFGNLPLGKKIIHVLWSNMTKTPIQKKIMLKIGVRKVIDFGIKVGYFDIYQNYNGNYWNDIPKVNEYINEKITNDKKNTWQKNLLIQFSKEIPFKKILITGCGTGWVERELYDLGFGEEFDGIDISEKALEKAKNEKGERKINYFQRDLNDLHMQGEKYDVIINVSVLHHIKNIDQVIEKLSKVLVQNGIIINYEYIGPDFYQYSKKHLELLEKINHELPETFRNSILKQEKEDFELGDNTEAITSSKVEAIIRKKFKIIYDVKIGGGIAYPILLNNTKVYENNDNSKEMLEKILDLDNFYTKKGMVPNLHWYSIGKKCEK